MPVTATATETLKSVLNAADTGKLGAALQKVQLGNMVAPIAKSFAGLTAATAHDITDTEHGSCLPMLLVSACRVTGGAAAAGLRMIGDAAATPSATEAALSADGKTLTFEADVTDFELVYVARSYSDPDAKFASVL